MEKLLAYLDEERGRRNKLATALGINPGAISQWERVPAERLGDISRFTGIPLEELRPDIFAKAERGTNELPADASTAGEAA
ncbi:MAG: helix-turn-helix domain-containing protein [Mesorhizobium sp.]|uniref:transcriptional regulator n=1 Tax=Mesorhizobium TaxID=68287 RepID=UPI0012130D3E|nr:MULTISPECIES: Cro/CI family transcriptional regulator [Mesorhizobium]MCF6120861.1 helix-turn-helix domain-containing protein [Mesorhizobium muleiense]TIR34536.1 MAG: helix-turn-helix domain-containing protein [Mesorhizobium sp.]